MTPEREWTGPWRLNTFMGQWVRSYRYRHNHQRGDWCWASGLALGPKVPS